MADPAERYCNDCAWPHECAAKRDCHRRERGEVRGAKVYAGRATLFMLTNAGGDEACWVGIGEPVQTGIDLATDSDLTGWIKANPVLTFEGKLAVRKKKGRNVRVTLNGAKMAAACRAFAGRLREEIAAGVSHAVEERISELRGVRAADVYRYLLGEGKP